MLALAIALTIIASISYASHFEWVFHRYVMHRPLKFFLYPFRTHAQQHHRVYGADTTYHWKLPAEKNMIRMAWWNGPILILLNSLPAGAIALLCFEFEVHNIGMAILYTSTSVFVLYFIAYETLHWCMHLPMNRRIERLWLFRALNGHHLLHHRYMGRYNFNVVCPLADFLLGTLLLRAPHPFRQPQGGAVPNVQPLS